LESILKKLSFFFNICFIFYIYIENIKKKIFKKYNIIFLFKCYCYTIDKEIRVDHHSNLNEINKKKKFSNNNDFFVLARQCHLEMNIIKLIGYHYENHT
jgi:hypothetical protein